LGEYYSHADSESDAVTDSKRHAFARIDIVTGRIAGCDIRVPDSESDAEVNRVKKLRFHAVRLRHL